MGKEPTYTFDVVRPSTGEVIRSYQTDAIMIIPIRRKRIKNKRWGMTNLDELERLATDEELTLLDYRLLFLLMSSVDMDNYVFLSQGDLAKKLKVTERAIRKSLTRLKNKGVLKIQKTGRCNVYLFNPEFFFRGRLDEYEDRIHRYKALEYVEKLEKQGV